MNDLAAPREGHWDFPGLIQRLKASPSNFHCPEAALRREAADAIKALMATNQALHRRVQVVEGPHLSEVSRLKWSLDHHKGSATHSFRRMMNAFNEIKLIYNELRRAKDDGCDDYGYHSVNDLKFFGETPPGTVWANRYQSKVGGIVSVRPAAIVGELIDELIAFRKFFGAPPQS